jgi:hypothetical protein
MAVRGTFCHRIMKPYFTKYRHGIVDYFVGMTTQALLPKGAFMRDGIEVFPGFTERSVCDAIVADADAYFHRKLPDPQSGAFVLARHNQPIDGYDRFVFQLVNYDLLRPDFCAPIVARMEELASDRVGCRMHVASLIVQRDFPDCWTKRPLHSDGLRFFLKSFIYLNDVQRIEDGPYVYVPQTHRAYGKKLVALSRNLAAGSLRHDDLHHTFESGAEHAILGAAGDMILSIQTGAHKGWSGHTGAARDVLVGKLGLGKSRGPDRTGFAMAVDTPIDKTIIEARLAQMAQMR